MKIVIQLIFERSLSFTERVNERGVYERRICLDYRKLTVETNKQKKRFDLNTFIGQTTEDIPRRKKNGRRKMFEYICSNAKKDNNNNNNNKKDRQTRRFRILEVSKFHWRVL